VSGVDVVLDRVSKTFEAAASARCPRFRFGGPPATSWR